MILDKFKLDGKVAIVTGGGRGLGKAMAIGLAQAGADIVLVGSSSAERAVEDVRATGRRVIAVKADLLEAASIPRIVETTVKEFGRVDILVNNAGIIRRAPLLEFSEKDWDDVIQINQKSLFFLSQAVAQQMVKQGGGGKIINIASMLSFQGGIRVPSYTASKSAVMGLTRIMANEWAAHGINVNAIAPGYMETDNTAALRADPKRNAEILSRIPAGRWGKPEDLQGVVVFLASAASDYMHGYTVAVDGGWLAR
ncbi:MAG TPA: 2-dehydro-3-deoxy-D-gluconate 5-dehydrogenase KduD [Verrucomicrobia bacterium]|nr:2-dehydro-3-deoxy-D-gluconate 5-dehydrogenase KduD [Verrucomicrobiota bacterium]HOP95923.1 2-dehydro-3-deoxy-D-gluconate 5-dehydrogenase KduD [Verrucomicrobiota bacterium]HPU57600.1 2-dehydro-3-deoxy-D-gluconate 5-dehydrogenase KduD [Verrucomicrobiota bacterium]